MLRVSANPNNNQGLTLFKYSILLPGLFNVEICFVHSYCTCFSSQFLAALEFQCSITLCPLYLSSCVCIPHLGFALPALFPALVVPCALLLDCIFVSSLVIQLNHFSFSQLSALPLIALMCICSCCIPFVRVFLYSL